MTIKTFPHDDIGNPSYVYPTDICHSHSDDFGGGYQASRLESGKMQKLFDVVWPQMSSAQWLALVVFWRSVGNAKAFYWQFPVGIYGSPGFGGYGGLEPEDGFDADQPVGAGEGPIFTAKFVDPKLPQRFETGMQYFYVKTQIREIA